MAGAGLAPGHEGGGEVEFELFGVFELSGQGCREFRGGVEAGDFVFVLVGEEFGVVAGDGFGQRGRA